LEVISMRKILLLPLLAAMALASQAWGAYSVCAAPYAGSCKWSLATGSACDIIAINPDEDWSKPTCKEAYENCESNGYLYSDGACATWSGKGNDPTFNSGVPIWCKWSTGCQPIKSETELNNCITNGSVFESVPAAGVGEGKTCTGGSWTGQGKDPSAVALGCCNWDGNGCFKVYDATQWGQCATQYKYANCTEPTDGSAGTCSNPIGNSSSSAGASSSSIASSSSGGSSSSISASSSSSGGISSSVNGSSSSYDGGTDPIISHSNVPVIGLNAAHFAHKLQIASGKDATVALFNIHGKQVFSQKVLSGTTTISLEKQRQGVYYAVVRSGSQKQIVKVILK
jgi:hypothetical protein